MDQIHRRADRLVQAIEPLLDAPEMHPPACYVAVDRFGLIGAGTLALNGQWRRRERGFR